MRKVFALVACLSLCAVGWSERLLEADRIVVHKSERKMELYGHGKVLKTYRIALGPKSVGPKTRQGDHRTPEGHYRIDAKNAHSQFHLSLHISYPDTKDRQQARKAGVNPGGDIMIHGLPDQYAFLGALHTKYDWTDGCIAVTNEEVEEIWKLVPVGTEVEILP